MALKKEQFLVNQPRNPKGKAPVQLTGRTTPAGRKNAGPSSLTPARGGSKRLKGTPNNVYHMGQP
jgi:hypothetical protein